MDDIKILEDAINPSESPKPESAHAAKEETKESIPASSENKIPEAGMGEPAKVAQKAEAVKPLSIFQDIKNSTEEDKDIKQPEGLIGSLAGKASSEIGSDDGFEDEKAGYRFKADIFIEVLDAIFCRVCGVLMGDMSDDMIKRFSLPNEKKKLIAQKWAKYMEISKAKSSPGRDMAIYIAGSYLPLLLVAGIAAFNRWKLKKDAKKINYAQYQQQQSQQYYPPSNQYQEQPLGGMPFGNVNPDGSPKKRGVQPGAKRGPYKKGE